MSGMKKLIGIGIMALTLSTTCVPVFASQPNIGVSTVNPGIETRSTSKPEFTETFDISMQGRYNFAGEALHEDLYTNYNLMGCTSYKVKVKNLDKEKKLTVIVYKNPKIGFDSKLKTITINAGSEKTFNVDNLDTSERVYIKFETLCKFEGWIDQA